MLIVVVLWGLISLYAALANIERIHRVYKLVPYTGDGEFFLLFFLGPIGLLLVMTSEGRWLFWRKS